MLNNQLVTIYGRYYFVYGIIFAYYLYYILYKLYKEVTLCDLKGYC